MWGTGSSGSNPVHHLNITGFPQSSGSERCPAVPVQVCSKQPPGSPLTLSKGTDSSKLSNDPEQGHNPFRGEVFPGASQQAGFVPHPLFGESLLLLHTERLWLPSHSSTASNPQPRQQLVTFKPKPSQGSCPLEC